MRVRWPSNPRPGEAEVRDNPCLERCQNCLNKRCREGRYSGRENAREDERFLRPERNIVYLLYLLECTPRTGVCAPALTDCLDPNHGQPSSMSSFGCCRNNRRVQDVHCSQLCACRGVLRALEGEVGSDLQEVKRFSRGCQDAMRR